MKSLLVGVTGGTATAGSANYQPLVCNGNSSWSNALNAGYQQSLPHAITLDRLRVKVTSSPGVGQNLVFTVYKNGVATALTCTISGTNTTAQDLGHSVSFAAGDTISLQYTPDAGATLPAFVMWTARQDASGLTAILGTANTTSTGFFIPMGFQAAAGTSGDSGIIVPCAGAVSNFYVNASASAGNFTVYLNGVAQTLSTGAMGAASGSDTSHSFSVNAGDRILVRNTGTGRVASWGMSFAPSVDGQSFIGYASSQNLPTGSNAYYEPMGNGTSLWDTTETNVQLMLQACTLLGIYAQTAVSPGVSPKAYTFTANQNAVATSAAVTINDASSTPNDASSGREGSTLGQTIIVNDDDLFDIICTPSSTPIGTHSYVSLLIQMTSPAASASATVLNAQPGKSWVNRFAKADYHLFMPMPAVPAIPATATLQDDFKFDNQVDSYRWNNFGGGNIFVTNVGAEVNHVLALSSTLSPNYFDLTSVNIFDMGGSYVFSQLYDAGNQSIASWEVYPVVIQDSIKSANQVWWRISTNNIYAQQKISGVTTTITSTAYNSATMQFFRIREQSGTTYWDYSADAQNWTNLTSTPNPMQYNSIQITVQIGTWQSESSTTRAHIKNLNVVPGSLQTTWSGYVWNRRVKGGPSMYNNLWSQANVSGPDTNGYLTLSLSNPSGNSPAGAEIYTDNKNFGYGTYIFTIGSEVDNLDPSVVMGGLFLFDYQAPPAYNEIDVGEVRYYLGQPAQLLQSHAYGAGPTFISQVGNVSSSAIQTFRLIWGPDGLVMDAYAGPDTSGTAYQHTYQTTNLPTPGTGRLHINIWVQNVNNPSVVQPVTVTLQSLTYIPNTPTVGDVLPGQSWVNKFAKAERRTYMPPASVPPTMFFQAFTAGMSFIGNAPPKRVTAPATANLSFAGNPKASRVTVPLAASLMSLASGYLYLPGTSGNYANTPNASALNTSGNIDLIAKVSLPNWTPAGTLTFISKYNTTGNQRGYRFYLSNGHLVLDLSSAGTTFTGASSSVVTPFANGATGWVRATWQQSTGTVQFFTAPASETLPTTWTQLGTNLTIAIASIFASTADLEVGAQQGGTGMMLQGIVYRALVRSGIGSTPVFDADFTQRAVGNGTSFTESSSNAATVTVNGTGSIYATIGFTRSVKTPLAATLSFSGTVLERVASNLSAGLSFTGTLPKRVVTSFTASLSFSGSVLKRLYAVFRANLSFVGTFTSSVGGLITKLFTASLSFSGSQAKQVRIPLRGNMSFGGAIKEIVRVRLTASLSFVGSLRDIVRIALSASASFSGAVLRVAKTKLVGASLSFSGSIQRIPRIRLSGALSFAGGLPHTFLRVPLSAAISFGGNTLKRVQVGFTSSMRFIGAIAYIFKNILVTKPVSLSQNDTSIHLNQNDSNFITIDNDKNNIINL